MQLSGEAHARLKKAREATGLTQGQAAEAIGKARISVARWEGGVRHPGEDDIQRLAELYQVEVPWILEGKGEAPAPTLVRMREATFAYQEMQPLKIERRRQFLRRGRGDGDGAEEQFGIPRKILRPTESAFILDGIAARLNHLLAIRSNPLTVPGTPPEVIQAIARGTVIPTKRLLSAISAVLGVDESWILTGNHPTRADHQSTVEPKLMA
jgi:transcriptional regulator with XRE-family HTH domain